MTTLKTKGEVRSVNGPSQLEFATVYRENFGRLAAFFACRCRDPQQVVDLTSQTFVEGISSAHTYRGSGTPAAWLIAIARRVYAQHLASEAAGAGLIDQLGGQLILAHDEVEDLADRVDANATARNCSSGPPGFLRWSGTRSSSST